MHAAARHHQRTLRARQQLGRAPHRLRIGDRTVQRVAAETGAPSGRRRRRLAQQIERAEQHGRPGPPAGRRGERHVDVVLDPFRRGDAEHLLGAALEQGEMVEILEGVRSV